MEQFCLSPPILFSKNGTKIPYSLLPIAQFATANRSMELFSAAYRSRDDKDSPKTSSLFLEPGELRMMLLPPALSSHSSSRQVSLHQRNFALIAPLADKLEALLVAKQLAANDYKLNVLSLFLSAR